MPHCPWSKMLLLLLWPQCKWQAKLDLDPPSPSICITVMVAAAEIKGLEGEVKVIFWSLKRFKVDFIWSSSFWETAIFPNKNHYPRAAVNTDVQIFKGGGRSDDLGNSTKGRATCLPPSEPQPELVSLVLRFPPLFKVGNPFQRSPILVWSFVS